MAISPQCGRSLRTFECIRAARKRVGADWRSRRGLVPPVPWATLSRSFLSRVAALRSLDGAFPRGAHLFLFV